MQYFIIRPFQDTQEVSLNDDTLLYRLSIDLFKQFEPNFTLPINVKQLDYYKNTLHQTIHYNGTVESLTLNVEEYNTYISKIATYQQLEQAIKDEEAAALLPQTLVAAKTKVINSIYSYAAQLTDKLVSEYATAERDRWASIILPEAQAYLASKDPADCPNLTPQEITRTGITDTSLPEFKASLLFRVNQVIQYGVTINQAINFYSGIRGKWTDVVTAFEQTQMETEKQAITRLLAIDYKVGWELFT